MQGRLLNIFLGSLSLLSAAGCVPVVYTRVPEIRGRVVDAQGDAVPHASVRVSDALNRKSAILFAIPCKNDGSFSRPADTAWGLFIAGEDNFGETFKMIAVANGLHSEPKYTGRAWSQARPFGLGAVEAADLGNFVVRPSDDNH